MDVISRLDERAAAVTARRIEQNFGDAGKNAGQATGKAITDAIDKSTSDLGNSFAGRFTTHGVTAGRNFGGAFGGQLAQSIPMVSGFTQTMSGYESAAGKAGALAGRALGLAFTTAATGLIGAAGYALFKGFERYQSIDAAKNRLDSLNRTLQQTGRAGIDVGAVMDTVNAAVKDTPFALDKAFSVATRALSSNTGDLKRFMGVVTDAAGFAGAGVDEIGDALLKVANTGKVSMDIVGNELRNIPILPWLQEQLGVTGAELSKMISDGKIGLDDLMKAVESHASGFAKASGDTVAGAMSNLQTSFARVGANFLGAIFGQPTEDGNQLVDVLKTLQSRIDMVGAWITAHQDDIRKFFEDGTAAATGLMEAIGWVMDKLDGIPGGIAGVVGAFGAWKAIGGIAALLSHLDLVDRKLGTKGGGGILGKLGAAGLLAGGAGLLDGQTSGTDAALTIGGAGLVGAQVAGVPGFVVGTAVGTGVAVLPTLINGQDPNAGPMPIDPSTGLPASQANAPASSRDTGGLPGGVDPVTKLPMAQATQQGARDTGGLPPVGLQPGGQLPPDGGGPAGSPILPAPGLAGDGSAGGGAGPKLPDAPVIARNDTLPAWAQGLPQTAAIFSAQSSYLDAKQKVAEKEARLTQLQQSNVATEDDVQKARNDKLEADRDLTAAELRLQESARSATEKHSKALQSGASQLGQIGASLDKDFGISKGLSGIAENLTKFIANLAAAPLLGQLGAVSAANPSQGGYGLVGISAAQGAFGPQYTGADQQQQYGNAASVMGPAPVSSGQPYGLAGSTNSGGYGNGGAEFPAWVQQLGAAFGIKPSTYGGHQTSDRNEPGYAPNPNHQNRGIDWTGPTANLQAFADYLKTIPQELEQVIWQNPNTGEKTGIGGGRINPGYYPQSTYDVHGGNDPSNIHVHTRQSQAIPLPGTTVGAQGYGPAPGPVGTPQEPSLAGVPSMPGGPLGSGMPQSAPFANRQYGANAVATGSGSGGIGLGGGAMDAAMMAAGGMDLLMPGAGQAAQTGMKLLNRGIEFAGQTVGIGVQGVMETALPTGGSELANNSWFTKILGGIAGAAPALPNTAGKSAQPPLKGDEGGANAAAQGQGQSQAGNTYYTTIDAANREPQGIAKDFEYHTNQANTGPGMG